MNGEKKQEGGCWIHESKSVNSVNGVNISSKLTQNKQKNHTENEMKIVVVTPVIWIVQNV